jgi:L-alanine-DL-glutamate epimerase-like enolase superfamily enzyme
MSKITAIRPVLLSAPYAEKGKNLEVDLHLQSGYRTTGLVEITLDDGTKGLGEGYLAVFAPHVFTSIVELITPHIVGRDIMDTKPILRDLSIITGYWSQQGAARHVCSAFEIALNDCKARVLGIPVYKLLGASHNRPIQLYGSGGDSPIPEFMSREFELLQNLGISHFKIRARNHQVKKAVWCLERGAQLAIEIAVDMTQNLTNPGLHFEEVLTFQNSISNASGGKLFFFEEVLGTQNSQQYPLLRKSSSFKIAGGEIVTTPDELIDRIENGWYDIAQPDATVIGGQDALLKIFKAGRKHDTDVMVHCWCGPVGMMANYHAALAGGGTMAEWPLPEYSLRDALMEQPWNIKEGRLHLPDTPGLGVVLSEENENRYKFREDAIYSCLVDPSVIPGDEVWKY